MAHEHAQGKNHTEGANDGWESIHLSITLNLKAYFAYGPQNALKSLKKSPKTPLDAPKSPPMQAIPLPYL